MSRQAAAEGRSVRRPSSPSRKMLSTSSKSNDSSDVLLGEVLLNDPTDEQIDGEIMGRLFRDAAPEAYRQAVAQQEALRAKEAALRREVAERRRLRAYTALLKTDVSGYTEPQTEEYRRELQRRSNECFGLLAACSTNLGVDELGQSLSSDSHDAYSQVPDPR